MPGPQQRSTLTVNGQVVPRAAYRVRLNRLRLALDGDDTLDFSEFARGTARRWSRGASVALAIDGVPRFVGRIVSTHQAPRGDRGYGTGYRARGLRWWANKGCTITNPGNPPAVMAFNLPPNDPDYIAANSGLGVGQILGRLFDAHASQLAGLGVAGYVAADLASPALAQAPLQPVYLAGKLFAAVDGLLDQWAGICSCSVQWQAATNDWRIRVLDTSSLADVTRTFGLDRMRPPEIDADLSTCASRVVARGLGHLAGVVLSTAEGTLVPNFATSLYPTNSQAEAAWNSGCFTSPDGATDWGTIVSQTGNSITVRSDFAAAHWPAGYFAGSTLAYVYLESTAAGDGSSLTQQVARQITGITALAAGGTCVVTWDSTNPSPGNNFTRYRIVGQPTDGLNQCWRRYRIANPAIAAALVTHSPTPIPMAGLNFEQGLLYPAGWVYYQNPSGLAPGAETPVSFRIDPSSHDIVFDLPVVMINGDPAANKIGGASTSGIPDDVRAFVIFDQYPLLAPWPPDDASGVPQYGGTSYTRDGLVHSEIHDLGDGWAYEAGRASAQAAAQAKWLTLRDTVLTGSVSIEGLDAGLLDLGQRISILGPGMPAEWATLAAPIRSVEVEWASDPGSPWTTTASLNNQRRQATGDLAYVHPMFSGESLLGGDPGLVEAAQGLAGPGRGEDPGGPAGRPGAGDDGDDGDDGRQGAAEAAGGEHGGR